MEISSIKGKKQGVPAVQALAIFGRAGKGVAAASGDCRLRTNESWP